MPVKVSDADFIAAWRRTGSPEGVSQITGLGIRSVYARRPTIERRHGINLDSVNVRSQTNAPGLPKEGIRRVANITGNAVVFSDAHFWPDQKTVAFKALLTVLKDLKPKMVVANGDIFDGARLSRHDPIGWEERPRVNEELEAVREAMDEIRATCRSAIHVWNIGNHDIRFARYLAMNASQMEQVVGMQLDDHIRHWDMGWSLMLNDNTMIKHRQHNGIHATYNNTLKSGRSMVTGHLHRLQATSFVDYNGQRWGVDTGCLLDLGPGCKQTFYAEDDSHPHSAGFVVLTYTKDGTLLEPEFCRVIKGQAYFRGGRV